jgi:hypothetical protein
MLSDPDTMEREKENGFPATGHLTFFIEAYKPAFFWCECAIGSTVLTETV